MARVFSLGPGLRMVLALGAGGTGEISAASLLGTLVIEAGQQLRAVADRGC